MNLDVGVESNALVALHTQLVTSKGGMPGGQKTGCVEGSIGGALQAGEYLESDAGENVLAIPAFALVYLVRNHCFNDGNKRIGWAAFTRLLARYRLTIDASDDDAERLVLDLASDQRVDPQDQVRRVIEWTLPRLLPLDLP